MPNVDRRPAAIIKRIQHTSPARIARDERLNAEYSEVPRFTHLLKWLEDATEDGDEADFYGMVLMDVVNFLAQSGAADEVIRNAMYAALLEKDDETE